MFHNFSISSNFHCVTMKINLNFDIQYLQTVYQVMKFSVTNKKYKTSKTGSNIIHFNDTASRCSVYFMSVFPGAGQQCCLSCLSLMWSHQKWSQ